MAPPALRDISNIAPPYVLAVLDRLKIAGEDATAEEAGRVAAISAGLVERLQQTIIPALAPQAELDALSRVVTELRAHDHSVLASYQRSQDPAAGGLLNDLLKELKEFRTDQKEANDEQKKFNDEQKKFNDQLLPLIFADSAILRKMANREATRTGNPLVPVPAPGRTDFLPPSTGPQGNCLEPLTSYAQMNSLSGAHLHIWATHYQCIDIPPQGQLKRIAANAGRRAETLEKLKNAIA